MYQIGFITAANYGVSILGSDPFSLLPFIILLRDSPPRVLENLSDLEKLVKHVPGGIWDGE